MGRRLIVEADGGSRGNPGLAGSGAVVMDATTGEILAEISRFIGTATNNVAEYVALIAGLTQAFQIDEHAEVQVKMDSKLVVEQMLGSWKIKHPDMIKLAIEAREVIQGRVVDFTWIPREENYRADSLANLAMDQEADTIRALSDQSKKPRAAAVEFKGTNPSSIRAPKPESEQLTTIYLVRHGRTELTEAKRISGGDGADPHLSDLGREDAQSIARFISQIGKSGPYAHLPEPNLVIASPIKRASETGTEISREIGVEFLEYQEFAEIFFGKWDGLTNDEAKTLDPELFENWRGSWEISPPDGESLKVFDDRIMAGMQKLLREHSGKAIVLVAHTMPIRGILRKALNAGDAAYWRIQIAPCSLSILRFWGLESAEVVVANSTSHLA